MNVRVLIDDFLYCKGDLQEYINRRFQSRTQIVVDKNAYEYVVRKDGIKFYTKSDFFTLGDIDQDYNISDLKDYPVAVDLGANIGGFTCRAAKVCKRVLALEPVRFNELMDNINLNNYKNVTALPYGIGDGGLVETGWDGILQDIPTVTFDKVLDWVAGEKCFAKIDTEGAEKYIPIEQLQQIDAIEMELHHWEKEAAQRILRGLKDTHEITHDHIGAFGSIGILHARKK